MSFFNEPIITPIDNVIYRTTRGKTYRFLIKRDDLIHPSISGNKWRKLKYNLKLAQMKGFAGIASFGGAFSNHIAALSSLGHLTQTPTIGFIRGEHVDDANPTLQLAQNNGMKLIMLNRQDYRKRAERDFLTSLQQQHSDHFFVPEGGSNEAAQQGIAELADEINSQINFDRYAVAVGSGGTVSGLARHLPQHGIGIAVVNDTNLLQSLHSSYGSKLTLHYAHQLGRYGTTTDALNHFCLDFYGQTGVPIEPIYTGKLFYNLCYHRQELQLDDDEKLLVIHTGGLQGLKGLIYRQQISASDWSSVISTAAHSHNALATR